MTSAVTGQRSNQLSYWAKIFVHDKESSRKRAPPYHNSHQDSPHLQWDPPHDKKWTLGDSNPGPSGYEPDALTN